MDNSIIDCVSNEDRFMSAKRARLLHDNANRDLVAADASAGLYLEKGRLTFRRWKDGKKLATHRIVQNARSLEIHIDTAMGALVYFEKARAGYRIRQLALPKMTEVWRIDFEAEGEPLGITSNVVMDTVSVWFRHDQRIEEVRFLRSGRKTSHAYDRCEGTPLFGMDRRLLNLIDRMPLPPRLAWGREALIEPSAFTLVGQSICFATTAAPGQVFVDDRAYEIAGVVQSLQADRQWRVWGITLYEGREHIFVLTGDKVQLSAPFDGKLYLSVVGAQAFVRTRSNLNGLEVFRLNLIDKKIHLRCLSRLSFGPKDETQSRTYRLGSEGPWIIERFAPNVVPKRLLIHLHGGPDSFEVDDLRLWGMFRDCLRDGTVVISLNYAGSTGFGPAYQKQAWRRWSPSIQSDFRAVLAYAQTRYQIDVSKTFVAGWSFGGSLGLHLAECFPTLAGVIAGAPMCDLRAHVERAMTTGTHYREYFDQRFDWQGGCAQTFSFKEAPTHSVPVLLLHGTEDEHCSFADSKALFQKAIREGRPWQMCAMEGAGHYGSTSAHAAEFSVAIKRWLRDESAAL
jgi:dienelactone hydrolase